MLKNPEYRTVDYSRTILTELMIPSYSNFGGKVHGGIILGLMDKVAYVTAAKHAGGYCVTVSMHATDFIAPVEVGDLVHLMASVDWVGSSSLVVGIMVLAENVMTGERRHTNSSYLTMVAVDDEHNPRKVPGLVLESRTDVIRFLKVLRRKELIKKHKADLVKVLAETKIEDHIHKLDNQNCRVIGLFDELERGNNSMETK